MALRTMLATHPFVSGPLAATFASLSHLRGKRIFHPQGVGFAALLEPVAGAPTGATLFDRVEPAAAVVRLSRSLGLPESLPDPCGLSFRVPDAYGPHSHQDFLLVTSAHGRVARHLLMPSAAFAGRPYSSLLPYRVGESRSIVGAEALTRSPGPTLAELRHGEGVELSFAITLADPGGPWRKVAELRLEERMPEAATESLSFNPANCGGGIEPAGFLNDLRPSAYRGSQKGRSARREKR
jgi:hypothetical protein